MRSSLIYERMMICVKVLAMLLSFVLHHEDNGYHINMSYHINKEHSSSSASLSDKSKYQKNGQYSTFPAHEAQSCRVSITGHVISCSGILEAQLSAQTDSHRGWMQAMFLHERVLDSSQSHHEDLYDTGYDVRAKSFWELTGVITANQAVRGRCVCVWGGEHSSSGTQICSDCSHSPSAL